MHDDEHDYWAIATIKARYFRLVDLKDWQAFRRIFRDDATFDHPTIGRFGVGQIDEAISATANRIGERLTIHHGSIPDIEFSAADCARGIFAMRSDNVLDRGERLLRTFGYYHDEFIRTDGIWKISSMRLVSAYREL